MLGMTDLLSAHILRGMPIPQSGRSIMNSTDLTTDLRASESSEPLATNAISLTAVAIVATLLISHWSTMATLVERWATEPQYSHGFVVPIFAFVVLWSRLPMLKGAAWQPAWTGGLLLRIGLALRYLAVQSDINPLDGISLLPTAFGLVLLTCVIGNAARDRVRRDFCFEAMAARCFEVFQKIA